MREMQSPIACRAEIKLDLDEEEMDFIEAFEEF